MLLVISNFGHLANAIIPSMLAQLEVALNVSMMDDRQVQYHCKGSDKETYAYFLLIRP
jgi:hypothetical protein